MCDSFRFTILHNSWRNGFRQTSLAVRDIKPIKVYSYNNIGYSFCVPNSVFFTVLAWVYGKSIIPTVYDKQGDEKTVGSVELAVNEVADCLLFIY